MKSQQVFVEDVEVCERMRSFDEARVKPLVESLGAIGLQYPISIWAPDSSTMKLVAGRHRLEAAKRLGWEMIDAVVVDLDEIDRDLWEIDENLCRSELSEAEEAEHLARRKELWTAREQRKAEAQPGEVRPIESKRADGRGHRPEGFATETAELTGQSKRTINQKISRAEAIAPDVLKEIQGSRWDRGTNLDILKKLSHAEQRQALFRVRNGASESFQDAYDYIKGAPPRASRPAVEVPEAKDWDEVKAEQKRRLMQAWNSSHPEVQQWFREEVVDTPVFDRGQSA